MTTYDPNVWHPDVGIHLQPITSSAKKPYPHQQQAWDRLNRTFDEERRAAGLLVVPTGGGKTFLAAHWLLKNRIANGGRVLWLAHRRSLIRQAFRTFLEQANLAYPKPQLHLAAISSEDSRWSAISPEHDVVFSSTQTAARIDNLGFIERFKDVSKGNLFVVLDEAHHAPAPSIARLLRQLKAWKCPVLGLTATPVRSDEEDARRLGALFDKTIVYQVSRRALTEQGILAAPVFETVKTSINFEREFTAADHKYLEKYGDLGPHVLHRLGEHAGRNKLIVEHYKKRAAEYGSTIVFAANTLHAQTLAKEFQRAGVDADYVDYSRGDAQAIIQRYKHERRPTVLVNVEMLTEGFDAPHTKTVFIARPTKSESLLAQMVGRALRGRGSGGNERAHLVTFLDTWNEFDVLDTVHVLEDGPDGVVDEEPSGPAEPKQVIKIPAELIDEAYRILHSNVRGELQGVFQCLPHGWYVWEEAFEDDQQRRTVMVYEHQREGFEAMLAAYPSGEGLPEEITEDFAHELRRRFFGDVADPQPRWIDVKALLDARRKGCEIHYYTFEEKSSFDPKTIAAGVADLSVPQIYAKADEIWNANPACRLVYRDDTRTFREEIMRAVQELLEPPKPPPPPELVQLTPKAPRAWAEGEPGYSLVELRDAVLSIKRHFPNGAPTVQDLIWTKRPSSRYFGFCRYIDKTVAINCALNSPDVPRFVMEFLMYHELLHADMPHAGHNADFRARERKFQPTQAAIDDATARGLKPGTTPDAWRVLADAFFDTFSRYYELKRPGEAMQI